MIKIKDILLIQKREIHKKLKEKYIDRGADRKKFGSSLIKVIMGPRRSGKSFFAIHILHGIGNFGYANFDDEKIVEVDDYNKIVDAINSIYNYPKYFLFDEIQNLDKWELFANRLQRQGYNLIITGSNSKLLSRELATHLTGRHTAINIFPFSFREFLKLENKELTENEIKAKLSDYAIYGGFPEPLVKEADHKDYISTLFSSVIYKDIIRRYKIRSVQGIEDLATYLISNTAKEFSYNTLSKVTKCRSVHTIEKYLKYLEETYILFRLNKFSYKLKEQIDSNKKIYCIDNGFIKAKAFRISSDTGRRYENIVAIELKKLESNGVIRAYYWKSPQQEEVDFVIKQGMKVKQLIQVCYDIEDVKAKEREVRALLKASKELKCKNLIVITEDKESYEEASWFGVKKKIRFVPLWKWLLKKNSQGIYRLLNHPKATNP